MSAVPTDPRMPPGVSAAVCILRQRGHVVTVRRNRNGDLRYSVDGKPETTALAMLRRFERYGL